MTGDDFLAQPALDCRLALYERAHAIAHDLANRSIRAGFDFCFDDSRDIMRERDAEVLRCSHVESYCRNAPTAKDFEQLVDPDAKPPANWRRKFYAKIQLGRGDRRRQ